jgi:hypothetical protein
MNRFAFLILILFSVITGACSSRKNKLDRSNLIPEKELTSLITDLYITDGLLSLPEIRHRYPQIDTLSGYKEVLDKHGYTKKDMDKTLKYYYIKNPKQLIKIYDQVLATLSEMESRYDKEVTLLQNRISNLWRGKEFYSFPDSSAPDSTGFDITVTNPGIYTLSFTVTLYPDDQSVNPRMTAYTCHPDSIETGKRQYFKTINYIKDGQPHTYSLTIKAQKKSEYHLRGMLYTFDNFPDNWEKHLIIEKIFYTFTIGAV